MEYTKGEWKIDVNKTAIVQAGGFVQIEQTFNWPDCGMTEKKMIKEADANAKLIAAAPDLLETCFEIKVFLQAHAGHSIERMYTNPMIKKLNKVIEKAIS